MCHLPSIPNRKHTIASLQSPVKSDHAVTNSELQSLADAPPAQANALEVAAGVWWIQLDLGSTLQHVNVYLLEDADGLTLVDTGSNTESCKNTLQSILEREPFVGRTLRRILITHHHPDHIGLSGWFAQLGVVLQMSTTCWHSANRILANSPLPNMTQIDFQRLGGLSQMEVEAFRRRKLHRYHELVAPLPASFHIVSDGDVFRIGARKWTIHLGHGHASDHLTLWSDDGLAIVGDQILPGISANLCIHACESNADPVSGFLESCRRFANLADTETKCFPGHNLPFIGIRKRCEQLIANQDAVLERLLEFLARPRTAMDCIDTIYRRPIEKIERPTFVTQAMAYLDHLQKRNLVQSRIVGAAFLWNRK